MSIAVPVPKKAPKEYIILPLSPLVEIDLTFADQLREIRKLRSST